MYKTATRRHRLHRRNGAALLGQRQQHERNAAYHRTDAAVPVGRHKLGQTAGIALDPQRGFFGSVRVRYFGPRPLIEDNSVRSRSSTIVNLQFGHDLAEGLRVGVDVFNVLNAEVSDIDYYYASRLPGEPAGGVNDIHTHPAEPRSARAFVAYAF